MKSFSRFLRHAVVVFALAWTAPTSLPAQQAPLPEGTELPTVQTVPGGYFIEWPRLTSVGGLQLKGPLTGRFEIMFDLRLEDADRRPQPPTNPDVLMPIADYWIVRGKPDRAIPLYRRGLEADPDNYAFRNNLAMLLSTVDNNHQEALDMVNTALGKWHDDVMLLDTKGLILMNADRPEEAVPVLERAVQLSCQGPIYMLHLAQALDMDGRESSARNWFEKTRPLLEASPNILKRENREMFDKLKRKYASN